MVKVLLVEDEAIIALTESNELSVAGYTVRWARSGEEAISLVERDPGEFDIILMDIDLGEVMDGTEAARQILSRHDLPVLFLSAHTEPAIVRRTEEITNYGYVVKSSTPTVLDASIKMALKLFQAQKKITIINGELRSSLDAVKEMDHKLSFSEAKFARAFFNSESAISISRLSDGKFIEVNPGFCGLLGFSEEELAGNTSTSGDSRVWKSAQDRREMVERLSSGQTFSREVDFLTKGGSAVRVILNAQTINYADEVCVFAVVGDSDSRLRQEKKRQEAEIELKSRLLDCVQDSALAMSVNGDIVYANTASCRNSGYEPGELIGKNIGIVDPPELQKYAPARLDYALRNGYVHFITSHIRKDGSRFPVDVICVLEPSRKDLILSVDRDISDQVRDKEELQRYAERQHLLMRELKHRIKNSLAMINSLVELASDSIAEDSDKFIMEAIQGRILSVSSTYDYLYSVNQSDYVEFGAYGRELAEKILESCQQEGKAIRLNAKFSEGEISADCSLALGLILNELITNCIKHAFKNRETGGIDIVFASSSEGYSLMVADDGMGMPDASLYEAPRGIGSSLVAALVQQIKGRLELKTGPAGSSVIIVFSRGSKR